MHASPCDEEKRCSLAQRAAPMTVARNVIAAGGQGRSPLLRAEPLCVNFRNERAQQKPKALTAPDGEGRGRA
jgi:hypothetical protein